MTENLESVVDGHAQQAELDEASQETVQFFPFQVNTLSDLAATQPLMTGLGHERNHLVGSGDMLSLLLAAS